MATTIAVAGATGNLGGRIVNALLERGAEVRALVRRGSEPGKVAALAARGVQIATVDLASVAELQQACSGVACVVSALQGLGEVIVGVQSLLLEAAVAAGVPRFIPSDYACDFTKLDDSENRNLGFRRQFHQRLAHAPIAWTSILNGAFAELLTSHMPLIDFAGQRITYWGDADQKLDFTTMDDVAAFTASAALDPAAPRILRIAGDQISARELAIVAGEVTRQPFALVRLGSLEELAAFIARERAADPASESQPYPRWQGGQYMHNMFSGRAKLEPVDNDRYPGLHWTSAREVIARR